MAIIYSTEQPFTGFVNVHKLNPVKQWTKHYGNFKFLSHVHNNTNDWREKRQANLEISIAQKKLDYWYKLASQFSISELTLAKQEIDKQWLQ